MDHAREALRSLDNVSGDRVSAEGTPSALASILEAQVHATLAVADALGAILGHLEDRAITVRSE